MAEGPLRARRSVGRCTACCRPSTSPPATASPRRWPRSARPRRSRTGSATSRSWSATRSARRSCEAAAAAPHWREVYACTPSVGGRLLEGYIDLLYRTPDGLVVVDYKTAGTNDRAQLDERVEGYRLQGGSYAISVARATGEPVVRVAFLFLTPGGAVEIDLADLDAGEGRGGAAHRVRRRGGPRLTLTDAHGVTRQPSALGWRPVMRSTEPDLPAIGGCPQPRLGFGYAEAPASTGSELRRGPSARRGAARPGRSARSA